MHIDELLSSLELGAHVTVVNEPFTFAGKLTLTLDGGDIRYWMYSSDDGVLSIAPAENEIIHFRYLDEELEPQGGTILFQGREYELSYEDAGSVTETDGEVDGTEDDRYEIADYESDSGSLVRLVTNENTGEVQVFTGEVVVDDEILRVE